MPANPQFHTHRHVGTLLCPWRRAHRRVGARAFLILFLPMLVVLFSPAFSAVQRTLTVLDDDGMLSEVHGELRTYDMEVAFDDSAVVAKRDSDKINTFHIDRNRRLPRFPSSRPASIPARLRSPHSGWWWATSTGCPWSASTQEFRLS